LIMKCKFEQRQVSVEMDDTKVTQFQLDIVVLELQGSKQELTNRIMS